MSDRDGFDYLPVSMVAEIAYCPRNFYYRMVEQWDDIASAAMLRGRLEDERRQERETLARETGQQTRSVTVSSERLGMIAVVDAVEETESGPVPLEYKTGALPEGEAFPEMGVRPEWVQLCAEAIILEEATGRPIERGYIYYAASRTRRPVVFDKSLREKTMEALACAWRILEDGLVPDPVSDGRCAGCSFAELCQPEEVAFLKGKAAAPVKRLLPRDSLARTLYVDEQGAMVHKRGGQLTVEKRGDGGREKLAEMPAVNIEQLVLVGNAQISTQAMKFLAQSHVEIVYLSQYGRYEGRFTPAYHKNVHLRLRQYALHSDPARSLAVSRRFVFGKLNNMRTLLMRFSRSLGDPELTEAARSVERTMGRLEGAADIADLMGMEGRGTRDYFAVFSRMIRRPEMGFYFEQRTRRPPRDPVNALLGFAYALLLTDVISGCATAGLDPYVGFFHSPRYGRPSLALDLMEEFRPIVADSVVLTLINKGMVEPQHFEEKMGGVFLNEAGREAFYRAYSGRKHEEIVHPLFEYKLPYHRLFELQARLLAKVATGDLEAYVPFAVR
ncbi:MAG: CRISPR-associated endonuclease Cas1 [Armatimonadetes bacterium]|nr:CRISPR-associated endonuclease Cas1 [Armatimonadota bacterium]